MKIKTISKKFIKPQTPTPQNLKNYHLSFIDQNMPSMKFAVALFYQSKPENEQLLEESLAKILVDFYPLAGRYNKNDHSIDCSDQGAMFVEAEALDVDLTIDLVVKNKEIHELNNLFPNEDPNPLLSIKVTHFSSGGIAIAITVSHKAFNMSSLRTFISAWSNAVMFNGRVSLTPSFDLPSLLPCKDGDSGNSEEESSVNDEVIVVKRFLFNKSCIARLRSKLSVQAISRVRVVCAVIARALIRLDRVKIGKNRDFVISQATNMRGRMITPLPNHACGNLVALSLTGRVPLSSEGGEVAVQELVDVIGDAIKKGINDHAEILSSDRDGRDIIGKTWGNFIQHILDPDTNFIGFSDWSKFGFYEADFGWGKPVWVSMRPLPVTNFSILLDDKEGNRIEAWVHLHRDDMDYFEQDEEIKYFSS